MQIAYYTIIVLMGFIIGLPVTLLSKEKKNNWIPKAFILGNAIIILLVFWVSNCLSQGMNIWARILLAILILIAIAIIVWKKDVLIDYLKNITKKDICCIIISYFAGLLPLTMYVLWNAQFPYCDGYTYISTSDYLMEHGYNVQIDIQQAIHHPWLSQMFVYQTYHFRIGAQMLLAFVTSVFGVEFSLELFLPVCGLSIMLCGMSAWMFVSNINNSDKNTELYSIIIFCFNMPIIQRCAMYGFLPQILGSAFFLAALSEMFSAENWSRGISIEMVQAAIVTAIFALTYNEMLPFFVIVVIGFFISKIVTMKKDCISTVKKICITGIIAICLIITYVPGMISAVFSQMGAIVGWNQNKDVITYMAQVFSVIPPEYNLHEGQIGPYALVAEVITLVIMWMVCKGYSKSDKKVKYFYAVCTIPYLLVLIYFVFFTKNPFVDGRTNTWSVYKLVQYYAVVLLPFVSLFIVRCLKKHPKALICIIAIFVVFNGYQGINYTKLLAGTMKEYAGSDTPLQEYYKLYEEYGHSQQTIELVNVPAKHRQMITYFLKDVELNSDWNTDGYYSSIPQSEEKSDICLYYNKADSSAIAGLAKIENSLLFQNGFYEEDKNEDGRIWRWSQKESEIEPIVNEEVKECIIEFDIFPYGESESNQVVDIYDEAGKFIQQIPLLNGVPLHTSIKWNKEMGKIKLVYSSVATDTEDGRHLAFAISNYVLSTQ